MMNEAEKTTEPTDDMKDVAKSVSKVDIVLHGNKYTVTCDVGDEAKLANLVHFVNGKLNEVSLTGPNATENRLFMLTCLMLADELVETRKVAQQVRIEDEQLMVAAVDHLRQRILSISKVVGK